MVQLYCVRSIVLPCYGWSTYSSFIARTPEHGPIRFRIQQSVIENVSVLWRLILNINSTNNLLGHVQKLRE